MKSATVIVKLICSFHSACFCSVCLDGLPLVLHMFIIAISSCSTETLINIQRLSLSSVNIHESVSVLSDITMAIPALLWLLSVWNVFFHPSPFSLFVLGYPL